MDKVTNIAKNTTYFTLALVLQKAIAFVYFTILARNFIPEDLGKYYFAVSFTTIFSIFIDMGLANVLTREVARKKEDDLTLSLSLKKGEGTNKKISASPFSLSQEDKERVMNSNSTSQNLLSSVMAIKLPLAILSILSAVFLINFLHYPALTKQLVYLSILCMLFDSFTLTFFAVARGFHNLKFESISSVIFQLIALIYGIILIKLNMGLMWQMTAMVAASTFSMLFSLSLIKFKWRLSLAPKYNKELVTKLALIALPFAIYGILNRFYMYFDSVLLSILAGDRYVGLYQVAFKIINALQFLPMAFVASLYPAFSAYWMKNREQLSVTFERAMNYLIIISMPISFGVITLADKIVLLFKTGYTEAALPLQISMFGLIFLFLNFPVGSLLNACDRQKINTVNMGITLAASIILNILLIPQFKAVGASITVAVTNILMFTLGMFIVPKITKYNYRKILVMLFKVLVAVTAMSITVLLLKQYLNLFIVVAISGLIYCLMLFIMKGFRKEDFFSIMESFKRN